MIYPIPQNDRIWLSGGYDFSLVVYGYAKLILELSYRGDEFVDPNMTPLWQALVATEKATREAYDEQTQRYILLNYPHLFQEDQL